MVAKSPRPSRPRFVSPGVREPGAHESNPSRDEEPALARDGNHVPEDGAALDGRDGPDRKSSCFNELSTDTIQQYLQQNPAARLLAQQALLNNQKNKPGNSSTFRPAGVNDIINIPVIVHIVLPDPYLITDAVVKSQITELNLDYAGLNADSTNGANFYSVRGHSSLIRFVLAKRTPGGGLSNGIDRVIASPARFEHANESVIQRTGGVGV